MNDPHVVALIYQIEHGDSINYSDAGQLDVEEDVTAHGDSVAEIAVKPRGAGAGPPGCGLGFTCWPFA